MAFPQVKAYNGGAEAANTLNHTVNLPNGIGVGDLLLIIIASDGTPTFTWPTGWTQLFQTAVGCALGACYRVADGSEGASVIVKTSVTEQCSYVTYRIEGHSSSTNPPQAGTSVAGTSTLPDPPLLTPTGGAKDYLWLALEGNDHLDLVTAYPTNYGNGLNYNGGGANSSGVGVARRELNAASENPGTFTLDGSEEWVANTIAVHPGTEGLLQTISAAGAIASAEAFGTPTVIAPQVISNAGAIATSEAFGTSKLTLYLSPSGIPSHETFGTQKVNLQVAPSGIASAEAFGSTKLTLYLLPSGISSQEAFGNATVISGAQFLLPSSITSEEAFGTAKLNLQIVASGIISAEDFGTANVAIEQFLEPNGIVSAEAFGSAKLILFLVVSGISSAEAFGTALLSLKILPSSIVSAEAFGSLTVIPGAVTLYPDSIVSAEALGAPYLLLYLKPDSIVSQEAFGIPFLITLQILQPSSIISLEAFGSPKIIIYLVAAGIGSEELFGTPLIIIPLVLFPSGISSLEAFGTPLIVIPQMLSPEGIVSAEMLGSAKIILWAHLTQEELDQILALIAALQAEVDMLREIQVFTV